ncbi:lantibiotic dehydratase [Dactylosporangium roseum]|uniref:Lantibiotic dehydratase n=1 Tax=Dactylosporangium roseum TaxID=47989 RepID=A0ABY5ZER0_9ACTN|nr:lantibiotic dehydratase family protein [Dactylosporangium roseum]UWZ39435.1 lantibiotic dehydratase [Dactylosporangium roseum]
MNDAVTGPSPAPSVGLPEHLVPFGSTGWSVWRSFCARRAGMPYAWLSTDAGAGFAAAHAAALSSLRRACGREAFLEALAWQNPPVAAAARAGVLTRGKRQRYASRTLAAYLARYAAKNDTVGFYGPCGWGAWNAAGTEVGFVTAPDPGASAFLELWAVRAVAEMLIQRHRLWPWVPPRVAPSAALDDGGAYVFDGSRIRLDALPAAVLAACDGVRDVDGVAARCTEHAPAAVRREIRRMQALGLLTRGFRLSQTRHPERQLRGQLERIADPPARAAALADLDRLIAAVQGVSAACGNAGLVLESLDRLDAVFQELTGAPAQRAAGSYYAGRRVAYQDCVDPHRLRLSDTLLDRVAPALELLLTSARWFSVRVAARYLDHAREVMSADGPDRAGGYPLARLLDRMADSFWGGQPSLWGGHARPVDSAVAELRSRWTAILRPAPGANRLEVTAGEIRSRVLREFAAAAPGWPSARWHSPDLMIAASSARDLSAGRFLAIFGELHPTTNSTDQLLFAAAHERPADLRAGIDADVPDRVVPLYPFASGRVNSRTAPPPAYRSPRHTYLGIGAEPPYSPSQARVVPIGALRVHCASGQLTVRSLVDDFEADLVEVLDDYLSTAACGRFELLEPAPHQPRVVIDGVVVNRESWRVPSGEIRPAGDRLVQVYDAVQALRERHELPRLTYCRIPGEVKPLHVDLDNPILVDVLWAKLRRGRARVSDGELVFTEMLPGPDQLWLRDGQSRGYTSEVRLVCVDGQRYRSSRRSPVTGDR